MNPANVTILLVGTVAVFGSAIIGRIALLQLRRFRALQKEGRRTTGFIIDATPRRIGELPLPVVSFLDGRAQRHHFRSHFPRRVKGFIHPEEIEVIYSEGDPSCAEIAETRPAVCFFIQTTLFATIFAAAGALFIWLAVK